LILTTGEPIGANCATGGVKQEYGIDANSNGILDAAEINATLTKYVCNGATGSAANAWGLTGNVGTNPVVIFLGTTDDAALNIKVFNNPAGRIEPYNDGVNGSTGKGGLFLGFEAGKLSTGFYNVGLGAGALSGNSTGFHNTAVGGFTLKVNTLGGANTAVGYAALRANISGSDNSAFGDGALWKNTTGQENTAIGVGPLSENISGNNNVALGSFSLSANTIGNDNTAMGYQALSSNSNGNGNVVIGFSALANMTTGNNNTALGSHTAIPSSNINSTAIGYSATCSNSNSMSFGNGAVTTWAFGRPSVTAGSALQVGFNGSNGNGATLTNGGVWTNASDSTKKENITTLDGTDILAKLKQLPITRWKYKGTDEYHIGPMAQDFHALFNVGVDDKSISSLDPAGIALKAIQEQQKIIEAQQRQIDMLIAQNKLIQEKIEK
jgi:Chaperone of endosialidase